MRLPGHLPTATPTSRPHSRAPSTRSHLPFLVFLASVLHLPTSVAQTVTASVPGDFLTIQSAIDGLIALPHDEAVIEIAAGKYAERLTLSGATKLALLGKGKVVIAPTGSDLPAVILSGGSSIVIRNLRFHGDLRIEAAQDVAVRDTVVTGALRAISATDIGVSRCKLGGFVIQDASSRCSLTKSESGQVLAFDSDHVEIVRAKINSVWAIRCTNSSFTSSHIEATCDIVWCDGMTVTDCVFSPASDAPKGGLANLEWHVTSNSRFVGNKIRFPISAKGLEACVFDGNQFSPKSKYPLSLLAADWTACTLRNNTFDKKATLIDSYENVLLGNEGLILGTSESTDIGNHE